MARLLLALLWLIQWLPMPLQSLLGGALGALAWRLARSRREVALRNLELCFPQMPADERLRLAREHFGWLARSLLERAMLLYAPQWRLRRLIRVEGDVHLAERLMSPQARAEHGGAEPRPGERPRAVMWLAPHFMALDVAGAAVLLCQKRPGASIYQAQSNPVLDAAMRRGRTRFVAAQIFPRSDSVKPLLRAIKDGRGFFNLPDMDFGPRDAAFVPFFGVPAATLLAPSRMARMLDMVVQPVVAEMLPRGRGWVVRFMDPLPDFPSDDAEADAARLNGWIETQIRRMPAQYLWVHRRFKTRPPGEPPLYRR